MIGATSISNIYAGKPSKSKVGDSVIVEELNKKAREYFYLGNDSGFIFIDSAIRISSSIENIYLSALSHKNKGVGLYFKDKSNEALIQYDSAFNLYKKANYTTGIAVCYNNIAIVYHVKGNFHKSIDNHFKALRIREGLNNASDIAMSYKGIGNIFGEIGQNRKAIKYNFKALEIYVNENDSINIAKTYNDIGADYSILNIIDSAIYCYKIALGIFSGYNLKKSMALCSVNLANNYLLQNNYNKSLSYYNKAIVLSDKIGDVRTQIGALKGKGMLLKQKGDYAGAIELLKRVLQKVEKTDYILLKRNIYKDLSEFYEKVENYYLSYNYFKKYVSLKDSILNTENSQFIHELETKYQTTQKEKEIEILQKDNEIKDAKVKAQHRLILLIAIAFLLIFIIAYFYYRLNKNKQKTIQNELQIKNLLTEQKMLRSQMNPHFIFNSLNSIQSFISAGKAYDAEKYLARFGKLMRGILENSRADYITLENEVEVLQLYIGLEQLRFDNRFEFSIEMDDDLECELIMIPAMLIQPFCENAILHAFKNRKNGKLKLSFADEGDILVCTIDDNGIGRKATQESKTENKHTSLATQITIERLATLSEQMNVNASLSITDKVDKATDMAIGTKVELRIPIIAE